MEITDLNEALKILNQIEDRRDLIRARYEEQDSKLKTSKEMIETFMMDRMKEQGFKSFSVPGQGTANIKVKRRFGGADWGAIWNWINEKKCPEMLQKRLLDTAIQKYLDDTGELPPGVSSEAKNVITVTGR